MEVDGGMERGMTRQCKPAVAILGQSNWKNSLSPESSLTKMETFSSCPDIERTEASDEDRDERMSML